MDAIISIINYVGLISKLILIVSIIYAISLWTSGVIPVIYRLGKSLSTGKIAVFAATEYSSLSNMLVESKLFRQSNIIQVSKNEIEKAKSANIFLVHWNEFKDSIDRILTVKDDNTALIVYAPQHEGLIDKDSLEKINMRRNTVIVNMRGRLLNDILISSITSNYGK